MGAWGVGNFDNDDAADWASELTESKGADVLIEALEAVQSNGYLEAPECNMALAAAEVVAALLGAPSPKLPKEVLDWTRRSRITVDHELLTIARSSVTHIKRDSELKELWQDTDEYQKWETTLDDLLKRLGAG